MLSAKPETPVHLGNLGCKREHEETIRVPLEGFSLGSSHGVQALVFWVQGVTELRKCSPHYRPPNTTVLILGHFEKEPSTLAVCIVDHFCNLPRTCKKKIYISWLEFHLRKQLLFCPYV